MLNIGVPKHDADRRRRVRPRAATWGGGAFPVLQQQQQQQYTPSKTNSPSLTQTNSASAYSIHHNIGDQPTQTQTHNQPRHVHWARRGAHNEHIVVGSLPDYNFFSDQMLVLPSNTTSSMRLVECDRMSGPRPSTSGRTRARDQHTQTNPNSHRLIRDDQQWISVAVDILHDYLFASEDGVDDGRCQQHTSDETEALKVVLSEVVFGSMRNRNDVSQDQTDVAQNQNDVTQKQDGFTRNKNGVTASTSILIDITSYTTETETSATHDMRDDTLSPTSVAQTDFFNDDMSSTRADEHLFESSNDFNFYHSQQEIQTNQGDTMSSGAESHCVTREAGEEGGVMDLDSDERKKNPMREEKHFLQQHTHGSKHQISGVIIPDDTNAGNRGIGLQVNCAARSGGGDAEVIDVSDSFGSGQIDTSTRRKRRSSNVVGIAQLDNDCYLDRQGNVVNESNYYSSVKHPVPIKASDSSHNLKHARGVGTQTCDETMLECDDISNEYVNNNQKDCVSNSQKDCLSNKKHSESISSSSSKHKSCINSTSDASGIQQPSRKRKVLGSSMVHRLMTCVVNGLPVDASSSTSGVFHAETEVLSAFYRRVPKLRKYFPYVLASISAECDACHLDKSAETLSKGTTKEWNGGHRKIRHSCTTLVGLGGALRIGGHPEGHSTKTSVSQSRVGLMLFLCRIHRREAQLLAQRFALHSATLRSATATSLKRDTHARHGTEEEVTLVHSSTSPPGDVTVDPTVTVTHSTKTKAQYETIQRAHAEELVILLRVLINTIKTDEAAEQIAECVTELLLVDPVYVSNTILCRLTRAWPTNNSRRVLSFLNILDTILHVCPAPALLLLNPRRLGLRKEPLGLASPIPNSAPTVLAMVVRRLLRVSCDAHALVATRSLQILGAPHVVLNFVAPFDELRVHVQEVLHVNAKEHWSAVVRADSDEIFDGLLDFA